MKNSSPGPLISRGNCFFCSEQNCLELRQDKHGRPYLRCTDCLTRAFLYNNRALKGPRDYWGLAFTYAQFQTPATPMMPVPKVAGT